MLTSKQNSVGTAIAMAAEASAGSAYLVPPLLMPEIAGQKVSDIRNGHYVSTEEVNGETCDRISHEWTYGQTDYWISQSRSMILQVHEEKTSGPDIKSGLENTRNQMRHFHPLIAWQHEWMIDATIKNMEPQESTKRIYYNKIFLNEDLPDAIFSTAGRE
jgi:hypothetical protein